MIRETVRPAGGDVTVEFEPGKGTTLTYGAAIPELIVAYIKKEDTLMTTKAAQEAADQKPSYLRLIGRGGALFGYRVGGAAITYLTQVFLARWIGSESLGIYVEAFAWAMIISILTGIGLAAGIMRFGSRYVADENWGAFRGYVTLSRRVSILFSAAVVCFGGWLIWQFDLIPSGDTRSTFLFALACVPGLAALRMEGRISHMMSWLNLAFLPGALLRPILFFAAVSVAKYTGLLESAAMTIGLHFVVIMIVALGTLTLVDRNINAEVPIVARKYETAVWIRTCLPLTLITLFTFFFAEVNIVLSGVIVSPGEVAIFNAAFRTALLIGFGIMAIDAFNMSPVMSLYARSDLAKMQFILQHASRFKFVASLLGFLFFVFFGRRILEIFGEEFVDGYVPLLILASSQIVRAMIGPVSELLAFCGQQNKCLLVYSVGFAAIIILQFTLLPLFGIVGGAIAASIVIVLTDLWMLRILIRTVGVNSSLLGRSGA